MTPRFTACIVTYRSDLDRLAETVASLKRCPLPHRLAIVDNDSGAEYVAALRARVDCDIIDSGANKGFGFGHNVGWRALPPADFHLVLNPDVILHEGAIERLVAALEADPAIGLAVPKVLNPDGSLQPLNKRLPSVFDLFARRFLPVPVQRLGWVKRRMDRYIMLDIGYDHPVDVPFASGCCMVFRRAALEAVGGFDEAYFMYLEDADICMRLNASGFAVRYVPDAIITHHWARGSHKSLRLLWVMIQSMRHHYRKWGWKWL